MSEVVEFLGWSITAGDVLTLLVEFWAFGALVGGAIAALSAVYRRG